MSDFKKAIAPLGALVGVSLAGCGGTQTSDMSGYSSNSHSLDNNVVSSAASFGAATLGSKLIPVGGRPGFVIGMNVPSFGGQPDRDLGKSPLQPTAEVWYNGKAVDGALQDLSTLGSNVVQIRLFQKLSGLKFDANGLVAGLDETFTKNLFDLLDKAEKNKLQVYVCLTDSWTGTSPIKNPISDVNARNAYLKKAVTPLAGKLKGRSGIFAINIFNEIETEVTGKDGNSTEKGVTWDQARDFIKANVDVLKSIDPSRLVSSASGLHGWENVKSGKYAKLGLDFFDVHVFDDKGSLPSVKDLRVDRPVLVGACGPSLKSANSDSQEKADAAFMDGAFKQGFAGILLSDYSKSGDSPLNLLDKDGKRKAALNQFQTFVAALATKTTATRLP